MKFPDRKDTILVAGLAFVACGRPSYTYSALITPEYSIAPLPGDRFEVVSFSNDASLEEKQLKRGVDYIRDKCVVKWTERKMNPFKDSEVVGVEDAKCIPEAQIRS